MRRRLSQAERVVWALAHRVPVNFAVTTRIAGPCPVDRLRTAISAVRLTHPLVTARVADASPMNAWLTTEGVPDPPLTVVHNAGPGDWPAVVEAELQRPFDCTTGPLIRFVVLVAPGFVDLIMVGHHMIADGHSALHILREILRLLDPRARPGRPVLAGTMEELVAAGAMGERGARRPAGRAPKRAAGVAGPPPSPRAGALSLLAWSLDEHGTAALLDRCRRERTTGYAALVVAFLQAFADLDPGRPVRGVQTPATMRPLLDPSPNGAVGLYVQFAETSVDFSGEPDFWALARTFTADLLARLTPAAMRASVLGFRRAVRPIPTGLLRRPAFGELLGVNRIGYDLSITHLGAFAEPRGHADLRVDSIHASLSLGPPNHRVLGVTIVHGRTYFSLTSFDRPLAERIRERAMGRLAEAIATVAH